MGGSAWVVVGFEWFLTSIFWGFVLWLLPWFSCGDFGFGFLVFGLYVVCCERVLAPWWVLVFAGCLGCFFCVVLRGCCCCLVCGSGVLFGGFGFWVGLSWYTVWLTDLQIFAVLMLVIVVDVFWWFGLVMTAGL